MDFPSSPSEIASRLKAAWEYRKDYIRSQNIEAFRLANSEGDQLPGLTIDDYAGTFITTYRDPTWSHLQTDLQAILRNLCQEIHPTSPANFFWSENYPRKGFRILNPNIEIKIIQENDIRLEIRLGEGQHTGLFLDQRENRRRIRALAKKKTVLNLFCYTGAFSINALLGGAKEVHSVDLSKNYLHWLKRNLELNHLTEERHHTYAMDAFLFLKRALQEEKKFDLIILDPPTSSRTKEKTFSTERDLASLVNIAVQLLEKKGKLFLSVNTRKMKPEEFQEQVKISIQPFRMKLLESFQLPLDFRLIPEEQKNPYLKACLVG